MPIYEFRCMKCGDVFEFLSMGNKGKEEEEMQCPYCKSENFERVISTTNFAVGAGGASKSKASSQTRNCSSGSCTTYELPGYTR